MNENAKSQAPKFRQTQPAAKAGKPPVIRGTFAPVTDGRLVPLNQMKIPAAKSPAKATPKNEAPHEQ